MFHFLQLVAKDITNRFGNNLSELTLVFPNQRARLFFNQHLSTLINKPIWAPRVVTVPEIMQRISGLQYEDTISLITKLYLIFRKIRGLNEPFENFYFWGEVMLSDFDQIDKYMVDAQQLFSNIKDIKEIEERFGGLTPEQSEALKDYLGVMSDDSKSSCLKSNFFSIWNTLGDIYSDYKQTLQNQGLCYEGMAFRKAAEELSKGELSDDDVKNIAFIGFNALNECEKVLFRHYKQEGKAIFYWDYAPFFIENSNHVAGLFINENLALFGNALPRDVFENNPLQSKNVRLIAAPSTVAQSKLVPLILNEIKSDGAKLDESTAVILPRENILIPTLQAIPTEVEQLNITMGYPLKETPAYSLAEFLIKLQINIRTGKGSDIKFYHHDAISILNHPYIRICEAELASKLVLDIKRKNQIYPSRKMLSISPLLSKIFAKPDAKKPLSEYLLDVCIEISRNIANKIEMDENPHHRISLEFLYTLHKSLKRLQSMQLLLSFEITSKVFLQLLRKAFNEERVSFSGEPLSGLQIMGFLETRALDFENIIILSFNDEVLPGRNYPVSFVTPSLRVAFGLPNHKHHDALYAYYFYRLLNRAKRIYLVYSNRTEGISSGEMSRYGLQLLMEQMVGKVKQNYVGFDINIAPTPTITIEKDEHVLNSLLKNLDKKGQGVTISPSGLSSYITCPLRFYFRYCAGIKEEDQIAEEVGALEFGKIIHKTMEYLYSSFTGTMVTASMIETIIKNPSQVEDVLNNVFYSIYLNQDGVEDEQSLSGRNLLARNAMLYTINRMLRIDRERVPFTLISQEEEVFFPLKINGTSKVSEVLLGGYIDRLEKVSNTIMVIDYKTGRKDNSKGKFSKLEDLFDTKKVDSRKEVFQIFCYCLAIKNKYPESIVKPALWFVKNPNWETDLKVDYKIDNKYQTIEDFTPFFDEFSQKLEDLVKEIFNLSVPFYQTNHQKNCESCPFMSICGKE